MVIVCVCVWHDIFGSHPTIEISVRGSAVVGSVLAVRVASVPCSSESAGGRRGLTGGGTGQPSGVRVSDHRSKMKCIICIVNHHSHVGSRYPLGCCSHAGFRFLIAGPCGQ